MRENIDLYNRACEIIARVLDAAESERRALIEDACRDDPPLRDEVDWLYAECQHTVSSVLDGVTRLIRPSSAEAPPADLRVAAAREYAIVRELGRGGMGVVYLAERRDSDYLQSVALKLLTASAADTPEVVTRFLAERQILAELNHPHIAHLVDGGRLPDGRPFIAMEYVDGQRIDHYCASKALSTAQRLRLFMKVCAAVHYAHQHLVIHRDIKPANIFVTAEGQPKLLDFGIARILGQNPNIVSAETVEGHAPLTLAYASPEQVEGKPLTTATDIYSLGVLLYELLAEAHPFPRDIPAVELARQIREVDPRPPSRALLEKSGTSRGATTLRWWARSNPLAGDLDAIVMKAMRKSPQERYQTAAEFADDIGAHLDGKPVAARRGEGWYRARKFVSRHRYSVGAFVFVTLLLILFGIERSYELKKTEAALHVSEKITQYFARIFRSATPLRANGEETSVRAVLKRGTDDLATQLDGEDAAKLKLYDALGDALESMGAMDDAEGALTQGEQLAESSPQSDAQTAADFLNSIAWLDIRRGRFAAAGDVAQRAIAMLHDVDARSQLERGLALRYLAVSKLETGASFDELKPLFDQAFAALYAGAASAPELGQTYYLLARAQLRHGRFDDAIGSLDKVIALLPPTPAADASRATYMITKAAALQEAKRPREAQDVFAAIQPILEKVHHDTPAELNDFYAQYAQSDIQLGHYRHARALFEKFAALCGPQPCEEDPARRVNRLVTYGRALAGLGELPAAEKLLAEAAATADVIPAAESALREVEVRAAQAATLTKGRKSDDALKVLADANRFVAATGAGADGWRRLIDAERLRALIAAERWDEAEADLKNDLASPEWQEQRDGLMVDSIEIAAARHRWDEVSRDAPKAYGTETAVWGACSESAQLLREEWGHWIKNGAPLPQAPEDKTNCDQ